MKKNFSIYLGMLALLTSAVASADCTSAYQKAIDQSENGVIGSSSGALLSSALGAAPFAVSSASSATSDNSEANDQQQVLGLLEDASNGSGLVLSQFEKDAGMSSISQAAQFINQQNSKNAFCDNGLMSYDDIVSLAQNQE